MQVRYGVIFTVKYSRECSFTTWANPRVSSRIFVATIADRYPILVISKCNIGEQINCFSREWVVRMVKITLQAVHEISEIYQAFLAGDVEIC